MNKYCPTCTVTKDISEFNKNKSSKDGYANQCRACMKAYRDRHYSENKERLRQDIDRRQQELKDKYWHYKCQVSCVDCGISNPIVIQFDHVTDTKTANVSALVLRGCSWDTIMAEINKCEPVCANCHQIRTHMRGGWVRNITNTAPPIIVNIT